MQLIFWICLSMAGRCLWVRRATWPSHWDGSATNSIVLLTINVLTMTPAINLPISPHLYRIFGIWNLEQLFGHICYIGALMGLLAMASFRLKMTDGGRQKFLRRNIQILGTLFVPLAVAAFVWGGGEGENLGDLILDRPNLKMLPYWIIVAATSLYLSTLLTMVFKELRRNPEWRTISTAYLVGCYLSLGNTIFAAAIWFTPAASMPMWVCIRLEFFVFALTASWSWKRRVRSLSPKTPRAVQAHQG